MQNNTIQFLFPSKPDKHEDLDTQKKRGINTLRDQKENDGEKELSHNAFSQIYKIHNNELTNTTNQQFLPRRNQTNHG